MLNLYLIFKSIYLIIFKMILVYKFFIDLNIKIIWILYFFFILFNKTISPKLIVNFYLNRLECLIYGFLDTDKFRHKKIIYMALKYLVPDDFEFIY